MRFASPDGVSMLPHEIHVGLGLGDWLRVFVRCGAARIVRE